MALPIPVVDSVLAIGKDLIERVWPDPQTKAEALYKLEQLHQTGELAKLSSVTELAKLQIQNNIEETRTQKIFLAGWRPFVGWAGGAALLFQFIVGPVLIGLGIPLPPMDLVKLIGLLTSMLGMGAGL